jgi:hypothetical protein
VKLTELLISSVGSASARDSSVEIRDLEAFAARRWRWREEDPEELVVVEEDFSMRVTKLLWRARRAAFLGFLVEVGMRLLLVVAVGAREAFARIEERALGEELVLDRGWRGKRGGRYHCCAR